MLPFPDENKFVPKGSEFSNYYSMFTPNRELGELGPGYPMFLELIKQVGRVMFVLGIIYFIPSLVLVSMAYSEITSSL